MLSRITPELPTELRVKSGEELFVTGYPVDEEGAMFQQKAKVFDQIEIEGGISKLLVFKDLELGKGMTGAPVMSIEECKTELLGVYIGYDETWGMHIVSGIAYNINK